MFRVYEQAIKSWRDLDDQISYRFDHSLCYKMLNTCVSFKHTYSDNFIDSFNIVIYFNDLAVFRPR